MGSAFRPAGISRFVILAAALALAATSAPAQDVPPSAPIVIQRLVVDGATVYSTDDVRWLLDLREGAPSARGAAVLAAELQERYRRDGYTEAKVTAEFAAGVLTMTVSEGRIDDVEFEGAGPDEAQRLESRFNVRPGDIYNARTVARAIDQLKASGGGALDVDSPRLETRAGRRVLIVPIDWRRARVSWNAGQEREDLFSPVDGLNPSIGTTVTLFDRSRFNHTVIDASASYKFAREAAGYSLGAERPLFGGPRLFAGAEIHDLSASDDLWRVTAAEQTLAALLFKNTFRDYYRRHGGQVFTTLQPGGHNELTLAARWDRHAPLDNETGFSVFRDSASFRPNTPSFKGDVNAWVIGYRFDTRPLSGAGERQTYLRHLTDDLYGFGRRRTPGLRVEWTSELAGRGLGGDARFDRHILDTRGYLSFSPRQLIAARALLGFSNGRLIPEREFALGGIGSVHGYSFKEARGAGMALFNGEYAFDLLPSHYPGGSALSIFGFYDAGRVFDPVPGSRSDWLKGVGFGFSSGQWLRIEIGFRAGAIPSSRQVLVRLGPSF